MGTAESRSGDVRTHAVLDAQIRRFDAILKAIANDPRGPSGVKDIGYSSWARHSIAAGGTKLRVLRYMLAHARSSRPRFLDVGAQVGAMVAYAAELGFQAHALDLPNYARRFGAITADYGVDYRSCDLSMEPLPFPDDSFDFVSYMDVLEHHAFSSKRVLLEIHRVLAPGGRVIITTPNHASLYNRLSLLVGRSVNDSFDYYFNTCAEHIVYPGHHREFTRGELRRALEATSFDVVESRVIDEDPASQAYCMRVVAPVRGSYLNLALACIGKLWASVRLPFGRLLWAVGEKPATRRL